MRPRMARQSTVETTGNPFNALSRFSRRDSELEASCHLEQVIRRLSRVVNHLENRNPEMQKPADEGGPYIRPKPGNS